MQRERRAPCDFYPRPPGGGRPDYATLTSQTEYISIHALRVEGDPGKQRQLRREQISIHALRVEGDQVHRFRILPCIRISIHALRVEGDRLSH